MQDLTALSSSSSLTNSNSLSTNNLLSPLFTALGWKDLKPAIVAAEQADQALALELQQAYDAYSKTPDDAAKQRLQMVLDQVIGELQADLTRVKKLEKEAAKRLAKPQTNSSGFLASWSNWIKQGAQSFFGSDDASLVKRYAGIAQQRQESIAALSRFREGLAAQVAEEQIQASTAEQELVEDIISPLSRRLLGTGTPLALGQYCYPSGACDLSNLHDGISGFVLQGEGSGDQSGWSVNSAGDMNGDGLGDVLVGAYSAAGYVGKSYVVFGSNQTNAWGTGVFNLSSLMDGQRGFVLRGEAANDWSGWSVSSAGDINGDGLDDILVGAFNANPVGRIGAGKSYVVFGSNQTNAWSSGVLNVTSLMNGQRGFVLQGEMILDGSGVSVSGAGDINGDGLDDVLIGAFGASPGGTTQAGKTYVVFGSNQTNAWGSGVLNVTSLINGQRGFVLQGEAADDRSGYSVSSAGDINGDGFADVLVGAYWADPAGRSSAGKSYVVFGSNQTNAWGSGTFNLTSLMDGQRGFMLQGEAVGDQSGASVNSAGDINGDGLADIVVGASLADSNGRNDTGKSYVIFGSNQTNAWGSGILNLTSLMNGQRGFMLQGEAADDQSGISVSAAGDINDDGLDDLLVGAYLADPLNRTRAGESYVVLGSSQTNAWGSGLLNLTSLMNGQRGFMLQGEVFGDGSGSSVSGAGDVNGDGVADLLVGAYRADSTSGFTNAGKSYVLFGGKPAQLWANQMTLYRGQTLILNNQNLNATDNYPVSFNITSVAYGRFEYVSNPSQPITSFNQSEVWAGQVQFVHDGTSNAPAYSVQLGHGIGKLPPQNATIDFYGFGNQLTIHQGESLWMSDAFLDIISSYPDNQVNITISNLQHGEFFLAPSNSSITEFTQAELLAGDVLFAHDGSMSAPGYAVTISDPSRTLISAADVTFYRRPTWVANQLALTQGEQLFLDSRHINVTEDQPASKVQFIISGLQHGQFRLVPPNSTITQFTQQQLLAGQVLFVHDKTGNAPSYQLTLNDSYFVLSPQPASINFTALPPILSNNRLTALQGSTVTLTPADLSATDPDPTLDLGTLAFAVSNVQHGQFTVVGNSTPIFQFLQAQLSSNQVLFTQDNSTPIPSYQVTVSNAQRSTTPQVANITFYHRPLWQANQLTLTQGDELFLDNHHINITEDQPANKVQFIISGLQHGQFKLSPANNTVTQFTQQQLLAGQVLFMHDKTGNAPSYQLALNDSYFVLPPQPASINFTALPPILGSNRLTTFQGRTVALNTVDLNATDPDPAFNSSTLIFTVSNVQHGQFTLNGSSTAMTQFSQAQVMQSQVLFTQDDSISAPSYQIAVSNPYRSTTPAAASISFDKRPTMINNRLTLETGESVVLAPTNLQAVDDHTPSAGLLFTVSSVNHGYFSELQAPDISITTFSQQRVRDFEIQFTHDGSSNAPSYAIKVVDGSGLESNQAANVQVNFKNTVAAGGIDLQKLYASVSSIGGIAVAIAGYLWWRRKTTAHRRGFELANNLRKAANLEYHDFMRFDGDVFKSKVENLLGHVDSLQKGFYKSLTPEQRKSFAVCIAEILEQRALLKPSGYGMGMYGWMLAFSVGWSQQLDFKKFEAQLTEIVQQAVTAWQAEASPTTRWQYFSPTCKDKVNAFCCARPSRAGMFARDKVRLSRSGESVSLTEFKQDSKHQVIDMPSSSQKDVLVATTGTSSSPRFFDHSAVTSEERLGLIEKQLHQVSEGMQHMHHGIQEIVGNVKNMHEEMEQLKAGTRPLLRSVSSSSS